MVLALATDTIDARADGAPGTVGLRRYRPSRIDRQRLQCQLGPIDDEPGVPSLQILAGRMCAGAPVLTGFGALTH